jgi:hypothetical protein
MVNKRGRNSVRKIDEDVSWNRVKTLGGAKVENS